MNAQDLNEIEAAKSVLGGIMLDDSSLMKIRATIGYESFRSTQFGMMFKAMCAISDAGDPVDPVTMIGRLEKDKTLGSVGGMEAVLGLTDFAATAVNIEHHAGIVRDAYEARKLHAYVFALLSEVQDVTCRQTPGQAAAEIWGRMATRAMEGLHGAAEQKHSLSMKAASKMAMQNISDRYDAFHSGKDAPGTFRIPLPLLHQSMQGFKRKHMYLIGGRTGDGKTALMLWMAGRIGANEGGEYFSTEMAGDELAERAFSNVARVDGMRIQDGNLSTGHIDRLQSTLSQLAQSPVVFHHREGMSMTIEWIRDTARHRAAVLASQGKKIGPIWIDYAQDVKTDAKFEERFRLEYVGQMMKAIASELDTAVIAGAQLLRGDRSKGVKRPGTHSVRGGDDLLNPASGLICIHRPGKQGDGEFDEAYTEYVIAKARRGRAGVVKGWFTGEYMDFEERGNGS